MTRSQHATVLAALLLAALPHSLAAQLVRGRVVDDATARAVSHASLELLNDRAELIARVNVDSVGGFRVRSWHPGKYRLRTTALGYATVSSELLELATGDVLELTIRIAPDAIPLEPIVITQRARASLAEIALAGYYDRRDAGQRLGLGRFYDRGAISQRGRKLTDVLATIPGVRVLRVQNCSVPLISMGGNNSSRIEESRADQIVRLPGPTSACNPAYICRANFYVDGVQMAFDETMSVDQAVPLESVEALEVYRRANEIPAEFLSRATCGVVAVWTRRG